jgi:hypothetical protein
VVPRGVSPRVLRQNRGRFAKSLEAADPHLKPRYFDCFDLRAAADAGNLGRPLRAALLHQAFEFLRKPRRKARPCRACVQKKGDFVVAEFAVHYDVGSIERQPKELSVLSRFGTHES